ncbi:glycosyltransferase [Enterococcus avium]|uniref:glycosyltransferase n=1 Tax=Enterococcus avium TaxID=33945 RepID=UPI00288E9196|nr:glycosyltransferase [Enterococcus avium]MDT2459461.1 glycosyltransferase [Enterococcus avium]
MLFVHDHVFVKSNGKYYTTGSLNDKVLARYNEWFKDFSLFGYERDAEEKDNPILTEGNLASIPKFHLIPKNRSLVSMKNQLSKLKKIVRESNGVISRLSILGIFAIHFAKKNNKPYIIEVVADPWDSLWNHSLKGKLLAPLMFFLTKYYVKNAPVVLYVTSQYLQKRYPTNGTSVAISDVEIETKKFFLQRRFDKIANLNTSQMVLATLANIDVKYKGQEFVIRAIPELLETYPNLVYRIYGSGEGKRLKELVKKLELEDHVKFMGQISHEKVIDELFKADIYIQPSLQEGLPRAVVESLSTGALVLGAATGGIPELIEEEFVFKRKDVTDIVNHIKNVDIDDFKKAAIQNFNKSNEFNKPILDKKRADFYLKFASKYLV